MVINRRYANTLAFRNLPSSCDCDSLFDIHLLLDRKFDIGHFSVDSFLNSLEYPLFKLAYLFLHFFLELASSAGSILYSSPVAQTGLSID
jgi:hypothetical protein